MIFSQDFWRRRGVANYALLPLSSLFGAAAAVRRGLYSLGMLKSQNAGVPVIVVGNITAGGGGKTPLVIAIVHLLQQHGFSPGVASRGMSPATPVFVADNTSWRVCGDEPLLIHKRTGAPVCTAKHRLLAAQQLAAHGCDVVVCDDGLQHYALQRTLEICTFRADFGFGNGWLLPAGPLREGLWRTEQCECIAVCGDGNFSHPREHHVTVNTDGFYSTSGELKDNEFFVNKKIAAVAGIAAPEQFFASLRKAGLSLNSEYPLADHARMSDDNLSAIDADVIIMTEKDAVKYDAGDSRVHYAKISALPPPELGKAVLRAVRR